VSDQYRQTTRDGRMRLVRTTSILLAFMVCLLLVQAATANADVMKKYKAAYKSKLTYYQNQMDVENTVFSAWKQATESHSNIIATALADPEQAKYVPEFEQQALSERAMLQEDIAKYRDKTYANIAAFKAKAVGWFKTKADRNRFKARVAIMRGGFVQIFSADESLMKALYALGTNADVAGATNEIMAAGMAQAAAEDLFEKGLTQLRALQ
jgi:predicted NAD-dependent protein-ADP-ribosyltransferase YbiA (DUF1768 family)